MKSSYKYLLSYVMGLGCLLVTVQLLAATEFKIFTLQHRFAEDLAPVIEPMVGADGTVSAIQNQLIVRASPSNMAEIEQLVATLDVARQNLKITVNRQNNALLENNEASVAGRKRIGNVEIGTKRFPSNRQGARIDIEDRQSNTQTNNMQFINVADGERAFIQIGDLVPFTQEWRTYTRRYVTTQKTTEFVDVSTGFAVRPRMVGNQVELEITPRIRQINNSGFIDFEELSTVVRVTRGEWVDIGGIMEQKDEVSRAILSKQSNYQNINNQLRVRVE